MERLDFIAATQQVPVETLGRVQDDVLARHDLQERLLLHRILLEPRLRRPVHKQVEDLVGVADAVRDARPGQGRGRGRPGGL